ncbi:hypothetical protein ANN_21726 [Periplaneta americana]|uniref:Uncharacterized protein n=1 Tax=Periplaneta americana TaxID=6978 RepID=A0ABQ8S6N1_PERAM|nr:hypothetical protein ANN_21726 [Periplaneta americana]
MKRVPISTRSRKTNTLETNIRTNGGNFFIDDIKMQLCMLNIPAYEKALQVLRGKRNVIWSEFYVTDAMTTTD